MIGIDFLLILGLIWIIFATVQDIRKREISNWLNYSLIIFALGFRFFYSLFNTGNFNFFFQGLIGFGIFFVLSNLLYYSRFFAGGDASLFMALGPILPLSESFVVNSRIFVGFFFLFLIVGAIYSIIASIVLSLRNSKKFGKEFRVQFKKRKWWGMLAIVLAIVLVIFGMVFDGMLVYLGILIFLMPYLYIFTKAVDESCMVKMVKPNALEEGDWLYKDVKVSGKTIRAGWSGLTKSDIARLRKSKKSVTIRYGIPFAPVFLISFLIFILFKDWFLVWGLFF